MKKALYIFYIPLLLVEWFIDMVGQMWAVLHESIKTITLVIQNEINEPTQQEVKQPDAVTPAGRSIQPGGKHGESANTNDRRSARRVL